ncbi:MAG: D-alanyl-D-alanine carboxypeptidase family protein [Gammaproteobacteria bacterium]
MNIKILLPFLLLCITTALQAVILPVPAAPDVNAKAYLLVDVVTDKVLADKNATDRVEPASLTKIMTVYVAAHELRDGNISLSDEVLVSKKAWQMQGSKMFIEVGDKVTVEELLMGIVVQSGNDASVALAEHISGTEEVFAVLMNLRAQELGMKGTNFVNATGWPDEGHYTTAEDLYKLTKAIITEFPEDYARYKVKEYTYGDITQPNRNNLLWRDKSVDGVKTGHTESAGYCLVSSGVQKGTRLISIVLGSATKDSRIDASQTLLNYGFRFFESHTLKEANKSLTEVKVWLGETDILKLGIKEDLNVMIPRRQYEHLQAKMDIDAQIMAPVMAGETYGTLTVTLEEKEIASVPLIALESIDKAGLVKQLTDKARLLLE